MSAKLSWMFNISGIRFLTKATFIKQSASASSDSENHFLILFPTTCLTAYFYGTGTCIKLWIMHINRKLGFVYLRIGDYIFTSSSTKIQITIMMVFGEIFIHFKNYYIILLLVDFWRTYETYGIYVNDTNITAGCPSQSFLQYIFFIFVAFFTGLSFYLLTLKFQKKSFLGETSSSSRQK